MLNSPAEIAKLYVETGKKKANLPILHTILLSIMAGIFIGIGGTAYQLSVTAIGGGWGRFIGACLFPGGLAMVILAGSELFTGNCLLVTPLLQKEITGKQLLTSWVGVYVGNFIGGMLWGGLMAFSHMPSSFDGALLSTINSIAETKLNLSFTDAFIRGILCNFIVCIAVWMAIAAKDAGGKVVALYLPIVIFAFAGFEHCVANMYYFGVALFSQMVYGDAGIGFTMGSAILHNFIPVTLGNIVGGAFVGTLYWVVYLKGSKSE